MIFSFTCFANNPYIIKKNKMGIFDKLFGKRTEPTNPDNSKLFKLLEIYQKQNG